MAEAAAEAEAARLAEADRAEGYPSKSRVRSALSSGWARMRSEPITTKRQIAALAIASRSASVSDDTGAASLPRPSSHLPISLAASRVTCACHSSGVTLALSR